MHKAHLSLVDFYVPDFILPTPKKREIYSTIVRVAVHFALILVLQICKGPGHIPQWDIGLQHGHAVCHVQLGCTSPYPYQLDQDRPAYN